MLESEQRDPRAPGDRRMYLYFNYSESGSLRWYVKVSRKGRRIDSARSAELFRSAPPCEASWVFQISARASRITRPLRKPEGRPMNANTVQ